MYYFNRGDEGQAWRLIGVAARACIEMGLHRRESLLKSFNNEAEYLSAAKLFWVVYALDRRWSFGTGMPFALQDADIDSSLPEPVSVRPRSLRISSHSLLFRILAHTCNRLQSTITLRPRSGTTMFRMRPAPKLSTTKLDFLTFKSYSGINRFRTAYNLIEATQPAKNKSKIAVNGGCDCCCICVQIRRGYRSTGQS
jgi:Fungal specific transcription factor domain